jgi:hypothetical protein
MCSAIIDESCRRQIDATHSLDQRRSADQPWPRVRHFEVSQRRLVRRKGIGLVLEATDGDEHGGKR